MKSSRRDIFNDVADHRSILKNKQNTNSPRFSFTPKTDTELPEKGVMCLINVNHKRVFLIPFL